MRAREPRVTVRIAALYCYPLKSAAGTELSAARLTHTGLADDRRWMAVTSEGRFLTQRELPGLARVRPRLASGTLVLSAAGHVSLPVAASGAARALTVTIWKQRCAAFDQGDAAAAWLTAVLGRRCRLVRFDPRERRLSERRWSGEIEAPNRFSDGFPLLVIGAASLADLNVRLPRALPVARFRPNVVIEGLEPYAEDQVEALCDEQARISLRLVKPCTRCVITTTDQQSGRRDGAEPLRTLQTYRYDAGLRGVVFGQNAVIVRGAGRWLRRGQRLEVCWKSGHR